MFKDLEKTIKRLNSNVSSVTNCRKAKELRQKLLIIGGLLIAVGIAGALTCVIMGIRGMMTSFDNFTNLESKNRFGSAGNSFMFFIYAIPFLAILAVGIKVLRLGLSILVTGYATKLIDQTVGNNCPNCGQAIEDNKSFCPKCGYQLIKECENCGFANHFKNEYCEKCGKKL